jgi:hypothetical protein
MRSRDNTSAAWEGKRKNGFETKIARKRGFIPLFSGPGGGVRFAAFAAVSQFP